MGTSESPFDVMSTSIVTDVNALVMEMPGRLVGQISDGHHTFDELYDHRCALFCALLNINEFEDLKGVKEIWKSKLHADETMYDGFFIAGLTTDYGQISYHMRLKYWDNLSSIPTRRNAPEWDGHTPADVIQRILDLFC